MTEISIDLRMVHSSGIGTYLRNLVPRVIAARPDFEFNLLGKIEELFDLPWAHGDNVSPIDCRAPIYSVAEQLELPRKIPKGTDLFWSPHYNIPLLYRGKLLATAHDVLFLAMPHYAGGPHKRLYVKGMYAALRRKADAIVCVSDFTKNELARLTGKGRGELVVTHLGLDESWFSVKKQRNPHPKPFLLFVGNVKPHKNLAALVEAFGSIRDDIHHDLLIVGMKEGFITGDDAVAAKAEALGDRVRFTGHVEEDLLRQYFAHTDALVLPSLYEGFGLPTLEAMACGCPTIVSDAASLPEVCGDAALYCDPHNPSDIAGKIRTLVNDAGLQETLREKGLERARRFTWDACAEQTVAVISRVLGGGVKPLERARAAIVHEWMVQYWGSEQVVEGMMAAFPTADLYALVHDPERLRGTPFENVPVRTSFLQSLPGARKRYQTYLPLMPLAVEQFDLRAYDLVLSSSHAVAKGALTRANQLHVSYLHTPIRYAWDLYLDYLAESGLDRGVKSWLARAALHYVRLWDSSAANRADAYLANSSYVARRIRKIYRRKARVIHPPVDVERYRANLPREDFYVCVSRFVPYKRVDLIVEVFTRLGKPLVVIGDYTDSDKARRIAGPNVKLLGHQPASVITDHLQRARAFVFAAEEDFGIAPVEAQAAGCPVIAYGKGGVLETIAGFPAPDPTGIFFDAQTPQALEAAIKLFESNEGRFESEACRRNAERFGRERFQRELWATLEELWDRFQRGEALE